MERHFDSELNMLKEKLLTMASHAEAAVNQSVQALANRDRVEIRGFGAFSAKERRSRVGRNPRTGQRVPVAAKHVPVFRASKEIRQALNPPILRKPISQGLV